MFLFAGMIFEWLGSSSSFCRKTLILNGDCILFIYLFVQIIKLHCNLIYDHAISELNSTWFCLLSCAWHSIVWNIFGSLYVLWCSLWSRVALFQIFLNACILLLICFMICANLLFISMWIVLGVEFIKGDIIKKYSVSLNNWFNYVGPWWTCILCWWQRW
jgi:hypothetical protein